MRCLFNILFFFQENESVCQLQKEKENSFTKKKGRQNGAKGYSEGDLEGVLDSVKAIEPVTDAEWDKVAEHYNVTYAGKYHRAERCAAGLKTKFRELARGCSTGGGGRSNLEKQAKEIEMLIDKKAGVVVDGKSFDEVTEVEALPEEKLEGSSSSSTVPRRTRMAFEKDIMKILRDNEERTHEWRQRSEVMAQERHREKMNLLRMIFLPSLTPPPQPEEYE